MFEKTENKRKRGRGWPIFKKNKLPFDAQYSLSNLKICPSVGGSPGLVVMGRDSRSEGCGFESWHCILDGHFSQIFVVKNVMMFV